MLIQTVSNEKWLDDDLALANEVVSSVGRCLTLAFGRDLPPNIVLSYTSLTPVTLYGEADTTVVIQLHIECLRLWCQLVYQLAHELCHVMTNYENLKEHDLQKLPTDALWFMESVCESASIFTLKTLHTEWQTHDIDEIKRYAQRGVVGQYAKGIEEKYAVPDPAAHVSDHRPKMINDRYAEDGGVRMCNRLASVLTPHFLEDATLWQECGYLNTWDVGDSESLEAYLDSWRECLHGLGLEARLPEIVKGLLSPT